MARSDRCATLAATSRTVTTASVGDDLSELPCVSHFGDLTSSDLRRDVPLCLGHRGRAPCGERAHPVELGERFLLLGGVPERPVGLRHLIVGDVVLRIAA